MGWVLVLLAGLCTFVPMEKDPHSQHDMPRTDATQFNTSTHDSRLPAADDQPDRKPLDNGKAHLGELASPPPRAQCAAVCARAVPLVHGAA